MSFSTEVLVCNPSDFVRDDYVEVDLKQVGVPDSLPDDTLRLYRVLPGQKPCPVPFQIDYPFGTNKRYRGGRVMTFFSKNTPPGDPHYRAKSATFRLEQVDRGEPPPVGESPLEVHHRFSQTEWSTVWDGKRPVQGVKIRNGRRDSVGLDVYFSLIPRPEPAAPINYCGAATSVEHFRLRRNYRDVDSILSPLLFPTRQFARWGQLTRLDFYPLPWEPRWYHSEHLLRRDGAEPSYSLVWSQVGPCRAIVTLASEPFVLAYTTDPAAAEPNLRLTCRLYRVISLFPWRECYSEQLIVRAEEQPMVSLAFRAHYRSYVDAGNRPSQVARLESIPDYFAVWQRWADGDPMNLGYAFASDSHIRSLNVQPSELNWRLQLGHEHRSVHCFLYEPHQQFDVFHTVGHDAWYQGVFKRLEVIPLNRYLR